MRNLRGFTLQETQPADAPGNQRTLRAVLAAPSALAFIRRSPPTRILHIFRSVCNLADDDGEVVSLVLDSGRMGPFAVALKEPDWLDDFLNYVELDDPVRVTPEKIHLGMLQIEIDAPLVWASRPNWSQIRPFFTSPAAVLDEIESLLLENADFQSMAAFVGGRTGGWLRPGGEWRGNAIETIRAILIGLELQDPDLLRDGASRLSGLGPGLTPGGDDFLLGLMHAVWAMMDDPSAEHLCGIMAGAAVPQTTVLSGAYLKAAAGGEAAASWQALLAHCGRTGPGMLEAAVEALIAIGHTSGQDALSGFLLGARQLLIHRS